MGKPSWWQPRFTRLHLQVRLISLLLNALLTNKFLRITALILMLNCTGCVLSYVAKNGISQMKIMLDREDINEYINEKNPDKTIKNKLELVMKVRDFCFTDLKLKKTKNYSSYVQLEDQYVSYLLRVAPKYELKSHQWSFPIVGTFPYLGFFNKQDALDEQNKFNDKNYDTYVRGVSAFSTLGWFNDPVLSSMLMYNEYDLVNLIIHETLHSTLFIKNNADFNERLATFLAQVGTELFYKKMEGNNSSTLELIKADSFDDKIFSEFISKELEQLKKWYKVTKNINDEIKNERLKSIQRKFTSDISAKMKSDKYEGFKSLKLNNARLLPYLTYMTDLSDFEKIHIKLGNDFHKTLEFLKSLEKSKDPITELKQSI